MSDEHFHHHHHFDPEVLCALQSTAGVVSVHKKLDRIEQNQEKIMSALDDANAALSTINDATNQAGQFAQTISTELTTLINAQQPGTTITPEFLAALQSQAQKTAALVPVLQGIASQGASNPVPVAPPTA